MTNPQEETYLDHTVEYTPLNQKAVGILGTTLTSETILASVERNLSGIVIRTDNKTGEPRPIKIKGAELINEKGRRYILTTMQRYIDKDNKISIIDKEDLQKFLLYIGSNVVDNIVDNFDTYEIKSYSDADEIVDIIIHAADMSFRRSLAGTELEYAYTDRTSQEQRITSDQKQTVTATKNSLLGTNNNGN